MSCSPSGCGCVQRRRPLVPIPARGAGEGPGPSTSLARRLRAALRNVDHDSGGRAGIGNRLGRSVALPGGPVPASDRSARLAVVASGRPKAACDPASIPPIVDGQTSGRRGGDA